jgi:hypothetical protein
MVRTYLKKRNKFDVTEAAIQQAVRVVQESCTGELQLPDMGLPILTYLLHGTESLLRS